MDPPNGHVKLHVKLRAPGPREHFAVTGSHEALGCWNPSAGAALQWQGSFWTTGAPLQMAPCARVEFKFVRFRPGSVEWEEGSNRVMEVPNLKADLQLQGEFNGESMLHVMEYEAADPEDVWRHRYQELSTRLKAQEEEMEKKKEEHLRLIVQYDGIAAKLRREVKEAETDGCIEIEAATVREPVIAPDATLIPSPSFAKASVSACSSVSASSSDMDWRAPRASRKHRADFSSPRYFSPLHTRPQHPSPGFVSRNPISAASARNSGRISLAKPMSSQQDHSHVHRGYTSEARLAALHAARGASPASPCSIASPSPGTACLRDDKRSDSVGHETFTRFEHEDQAYQNSSVTVGIVASKEVEAAFASANARYSKQQTDLQVHRDNGPQG